MITLSYKGYIGSVEVSQEDECFFGKVLSLPGNILISYEGANLKELRYDFRAAVDDYLELCDEQRKNAML